MIQKGSVPRFFRHSPGDVTVRSGLAREPSRNPGAWVVKVRKRFKKAWAAERIFALVLFSIWVDKKQKIRFSLPHWSVTVVDYTLLFLSKLCRNRFEKRIGHGEGEEFFSREKISFLSTASPDLIGNRVLFKCENRQHLNNFFTSFCCAAVAKCCALEYSYH